MGMLDDYGIEGFVDLRKCKPKSTFDKTYLTHKNEKFNYQLDKNLTVKVKSIDLMKRKLELEVV